MGNLYHFVLAYKFQKDKDELVKNLDLATKEAATAKKYLYESQHGIFSTWYSNAEPLTRTFQIDSLINRISLLKKEAKDK